MQGAGIGLAEANVLEQPLETSDEALHDPNVLLIWPPPHTHGRKVVIVDVVRDMHIVDVTNAATGGEQSDHEQGILGLVT